MLHGDGLVRAVVVYGGVFQGLFERAWPAVRVTLAMAAWIDALRPGEPFHVPTRPLAECAGVGLTEAARGSLGHWLTIEDGRIRNYQIISPTTWNFSPRDELGTPGALEQALLDTPVDDGARQPVAVQHIVRSFDPCMVCTVH